MLRRGSDDGLIAENHWDIKRLVQRTPSQELARPQGVAILGGAKNMKCDPDLPCLHRDDGAWFHFQITVNEEPSGLQLYGYDFEICLHALPSFQRGPRWLRYDLNLPDHNNQHHGLRSHLHPGLEEVQTPAPLMAPLEILDLFIHGLRASPRARAA